MFYLSFKEWVLTEAPIDHPNSFKAVFMAGGPGSGKSWLAQAMFGGTDFQFSNSDHIMKLLAKKQGKPDLIKATDGSSIYDDKQRIQKMAIDLTKKRTSLWQSEGIPFVIDITGRNLELVKTLKAKLEEQGYDTYMMFVDTNLETAIKRNDRRASDPDSHVADIEYLKQAWQMANGNIESLKYLFGKNFFSISNNSEYQDHSEINAAKRKAYQYARNGILSRPLQNPKGLEKVKFGHRASA